MRKGTSKTRGWTRSKANVLPVINHAVIFSMWKLWCVGDRITVTGCLVTGSFCGWLHILALLLRQFNLSLSKRQKNSALHISHLYATATRGTAWRPGFRNKPARNSPVETVPFYSIQSCLCVHNELSHRNVCLCTKHTIHNTTWWLNWLHNQVT